MHHSLRGWSPRWIFFPVSSERVLPASSGSLCLVTDRGALGLLLSHLNTWWERKGTEGERFSITKANGHCVNVGGRYFPLESFPPASPSPLRLTPKC